MEDTKKELTNELLRVYKYKDELRTRILYTLVATVRDINFLPVGSFIRKLESAVNELDVRMKEYDEEIDRLNDKLNKL